MLFVANSLGELDFPQLMKIYIEGNREHGEDCWPEKSLEEQLSLSEQDFYTYLRERFFTKAGAVYMVWSENGRYVSALRLEPYRDGLLLEALETLPEEWRKGYAASLICAVQEWLKESEVISVYSHVSKQNTASLRTHVKCGFEIFLDHSYYNDGTRMDNTYTMRYQVRN